MAYKYTGTLSDKLAPLKLDSKLMSQKNQFCQL